MSIPPPLVFVFVKISAVGSTIMEEITDLKNWGVNSRVPASFFRRNSWLVAERLHPLVPTLLIPGALPVVIIRSPSVGLSEQSHDQYSVSLDLLECVAICVNMCVFCVRKENECVCVFVFVEGEDECTR